jgi:hypothetical protein
MPATRPRYWANGSVPPHARTASATCRATPSPPQTTTTPFTRATFDSTWDSPPAASGAAGGGEGVGATGARASAAAGAATRGAGPPRFLNSLRMLWTRPRIVASGAVTPRAFASATTASAGISRSAARTARTTGDTAGPAFRAGAVVFRAAGTGVGLAAGAAAFFLSFLRTVWTVPRTTASGNFRPRALTVAMTSSAVRLRSAVRMSRTRDQTVGAGRHRPEPRRCRAADRDRRPAGRGLAAGREGGRPGER